MKIVVVGHGGDLGLGHRLGQGQAQGDVHGDGQGVFHHQQIDVKGCDEPVDGLLEKGSQVVNGLGGLVEGCASFGP